MTPYSRTSGLASILTEAIATVLTFGVMGDPSAGASVRFVVVSLPALLESHVSAPPRVIEVPMVCLMVPLAEAVRYTGSFGTNTTGIGPS